MSSTSVAFPPDTEIRHILGNRIDAQRKSVGIVIGLIAPDRRDVMAHRRLADGDPRAPNGDTVFEIASLTKVFTCLALAEMVVRGDVALTDPVAQYLPADVKLPQRDGRSITLVDLATHFTFEFDLEFVAERDQHALVECLHLRPGRMVPAVTAKRVRVPIEA